MNTDSAKQIQYEKIQSKTKDKVLYSACGRIIKSVSGHNYLAAIKEVSAKESNYFKVYGI